MSTDSTPSAASASVAAVRSSHDRLADLLAALPEAEHTRKSYDTEWSIAQVASHLGSQAEIFELFPTPAPMTSCRPRSSSSAPSGRVGTRWSRRSR